MYDVCIIGAGIVGCFLAHDLSMREIRVLLLEKESDVANGATMANSAIIHAGNDPKDGTLKALMNVRGNRMYEDICRELGVAYTRTSALVVAVSPEEEQTLLERYDRAISRGIPAELLTREEAIAREPNLSSLVTRAMEVPTTGIICPWEVTIALAEEAVLNGVELHLEETVLRIVKNTGGPGQSDGDPEFTIYTHDNMYEAKCVINCAGVFADRIYAMVSDKNPIPFAITPRRGEYFVIDKLKVPVVRRVIYPVPSKAGKGILATPTIDGNLLLGPNAQDIDDCEGINNTYEGLSFVREKISKTVQNIPMNKVIRQFAGLRAKGNNGDFLIEEADDVRHFINVACIDSPGLTSAPAISEYVIGKFLAKSFPLDMKNSYSRRRPTVSLRLMSAADRAKLVAEDPAFGNIVCRCEQITEGEILDVIRRPVGARTVKGVKKRARPGMGRCQGGFCEPRVVEILAQELGIPKTDVRYDSPASLLLVGETKEFRKETTL
ncbi:MAG: NAD(P)/FAD-dependent oxidoreductase [Eubacteriales bacterium]